MRPAASVRLCVVALAVSAGEPLEPAGETLPAPEGVPFEIEAHRIFVPVRVGDSLALRLFLDTGLTYPGIFLFHEERIAELGLSGWMDVLVPGAGDGGPSTAVMADSVDLYLGDTRLPRQRVVVSRSERTQSFPSEGILGGTVFDSFALEVDYDSMRLFLHDPVTFVPDSSWTVVPIELRRGIPWLDAFVELDDRAESLRVYVDLADDLPLTLLTGSGRRVEAPAEAEERYLGTGLSGDIHGRIGEVEALHIGPFRIPRVRAAFAPAATRSKQDGADGILGNGLLERFHVVFDYRGGRLLLKPNERFAEVSAWPEAPGPR